MIDLKDLADKDYIIAKKRNNLDINKPIDTLGILKHTATEIVEATEAYAKDDMPAFASELGDIITCCLIICSKNQIKIEEVLMQTMEKNKKRSEKND